MLKNLRKWRNFNSPDAATLQGWDDHESAFKANAPIRYFMKETLWGWYLKCWVWPISNPIRDRYHKVRNVLLPWHRYHLIKTDLSYDYHDTDTRMLHSNFTLLVNFVEIEKAWMQYLSKESNLHPKNIWQRITFRSREMGLAHIDWEIELDNPKNPNKISHGKPPPPWSPEGHPSQAESARQQKRLYIWWKDVYLNRPCLYEMPEDTDTLAVEAKYLEEEQEALAMLVRIRKTLWT